MNIFNLLKKTKLFLDINIGDAQDKSLFDEGYTKVSTSKYLYYKYLLPFVIIALVLVFARKEGFIINNNYNLIIIPIVISIIIYIFTYRRIKTVYYGHNKFLVFNTYKKEINIINRSDIKFLERKDFKFFYSDYFYLIYYIENSKTKKVFFVPSSDQLKLIETIEKEIDERNRNGI